MGIEPTFQAWEACVLPLNYTRLDSINNGSIMADFTTILQAM